MNDSQRNTLQRYRRRLADDLILTEEFLAQLIEEGIFEWGMMNLIKAEKTESEQIYKMLELLPKRGPLAFERFIGVLERDYPWLATLLISSTSKSTPLGKADHLNNHHHNHHNHHQHQHQLQLQQPRRESVRPELVAVEVNSRGTPGAMEGCDSDIKKLVASFVHRQFGQSKRISEKDKKAVEKFVSDQLQQERVRYQGMLPSHQHFASCPSSLSEGDDEVFDARDVQEHLFRIHMKIEPHLHDQDDLSPTPSNDRNIDNNNKTGSTTTTTTTTSNNTTTTTSSSNNGSGDNVIIHGGCHQIRERLLPDDLSFEIIHKEMDTLCLKLRDLQDQVSHSMQHFKPEVQETPLPELVRRMHDVLRKQQRELEETEDHNRRLLDEVHRYSDHIEKLEKERKEYRAQVNVLHQDMAKIRQEKMALQERFTGLEKSHKERLEKESTLDNLRLIVKDFRNHTGMTPRHTNIHTPRGGGGDGDGGGRGGVQGRRSMRMTTGGKQVASYPLYARRFTPSTRVLVKKNKGSNNASSSGTK